MHCGILIHSNGSLLSNNGEISSFTHFFFFLQTICVEGVCDLVGIDFWVHETTSQTERRTKLSSSMIFFARDGLSFLSIGDICIFIEVEVVWVSIYNGPIKPLWNKVPQRKKSQEIRLTRSVKYSKYYFKKVECFIFT